MPRSHRRPGRPPTLTQGLQHSPGRKTFTILLIATIEALVETSHVGKSPVFDRSGPLQAQLACHDFIAKRCLHKAVLRPPPFRPKVLKRLEFSGKRDCFGVGHTQIRFLSEHEAGFNTLTYQSSRWAAKVDTLHTSLWGFQILAAPEPRRGRIGLDADVDGLECVYDWCRRGRLGNLVKKVSNNSGDLSITLPATPFGCGDG